MMPLLNNSLKRWLKGFMLKHLPGMMTCREFEAFVTDYTEGELSTEQYTRFKRHLAMCRECRQYLHAYQRTIELTQAAFPSPDEPVPDDVPEALIKAILQSRDS